MYSTYILFSNTLNKFYIGSTSAIEERVRKHNTNHKGFTGGIGDWQLVYEEKFESKHESIKREQQIKKWKSRKMILQLIKSIETFTGVGE